VLLVGLRFAEADTLRAALGINEPAASAFNRGHLGAHRRPARRDRSTLAVDSGSCFSRAWGSDPRRRASSMA
jgi:hypothetical protein